MGSENLAQLIRERGAVEMAQTIRAGAIVAALNEGWDLTNWTVTATGGALLFARVDGERRYTDDPRILCVNAPESERATWEARLLQWATEGEPPDADTILLMIPFLLPEAPL